MSVAQMRVVMSLVLVGVAVADPTWARTITVEKDGTGDYRVIQDALDVSAPGDTVLVGPGRYTDTRPYVPPGWSIAVDIYAIVNTDNLTIIGAGADKTIIGPDIYEYSASDSPMGIVQVFSQGTLRISSLSLINCHLGYADLYVNASRVELDSCAFRGWRIGMLVTDAGGHASNCEYTDQLLSIHVSSASDFIISSCVFSGSGEAVQFGNGASNGIIEDCVVNGNIVGIALSISSGITVRRNRIHNTRVGIVIRGTGHVLEGNHIEVYGDCLRQLGAIAQVERNVMISSGDHVVQVVSTPQYLSNYRDNHFIRHGDANVFDVSLSHDGEPVVLDLENNYWGTTSADSISAWIYDAHDDVSAGAYVDYEPYHLSPVENDTKSFGGVKRMFR